MGSLRWLAMAFMVVAVPLMGGSGPGVATADSYTLNPPYLRQGESLYAGWILGGSPAYKGLEHAYLHLQRDCNLVLYRAESQQALWASNTAGKAHNCYLVMQQDCNAVIYETSTQNALWASGTAGLDTDCWLEVTVDETVAAIYNSDRDVIWSTDTVQP